MPSMLIDSTCSVQVPAESQVIVSVLREMVQGFITSAGSHPGRKREAEDNSRKIGALFWRANAGELPPEVLNKLRSLAQAIQAGNTQDATAIQVGALTRVSLTLHLVTHGPRPGCCAYC